MYMELSLRGILNALFKHQLKMIVIAGVIVCIGLIYSLGIGKRYDSHASLLVKFGQDAVSGLERNSQKDAVRYDRSEILKSYVKILKSRDLLKAAVEKIGHERLYPEKQDNKDSQEEAAIDPVRLAVARMVQDLEVYEDDKSNIIDLRVINENPQIAADFASILIDAFIAYQNKIYSNTDTSILDERIAEARTGLDQVNKEFLEFKQATGISELNKEMDLLLTEKSDLTSIAFSAVSRAQEELAELRAREAEMLVTYNENSPLLKSLQDRITVVQQTLDDRQDDLVAEEDNGGALVPKLESIDERIAYLEKYRSEYEEHKQAVDTKEADYNYYKQKVEDARISDILRQKNITRISVLDKPEVSVRAIPRRRVFLMIAFMLAGAFCAFGVALIYELLDDRVSNSESIRLGTKLPVLASFDEAGKGR